MKINKSIVAYFVLTFGYLTIFGLFDKIYCDIASAIMVVCIAYFICQPKFFGLVIALFFSSFLVSQFGLYYLLKRDGISEPIKFVISKSPASIFANGFAPFFSGIATYFLCKRLFSVWKNVRSEWEEKNLEMPSTVSNAIKFLFSALLIGVMEVTQKFSSLPSWMPFAIYTIVAILSFLFTFFIIYMMAKGNRFCLNIIVFLNIVIIVFSLLYITQGVTNNTLYSLLIIIQIIMQFVAINSLLSNSSLLWFKKTKEVKSGNSQSG